MAVAAREVAVAMAVAVGRVVVQAATEAAEEEREAWVTPAATAAYEAAAGSRNSLVVVTWHLKGTGAALGSLRKTASSTLHSHHRISSRHTSEGCLMSTGHGHGDRHSNRPPR